MKKNIIGVAAILMISSTASAGALTIPNTFTAGTPAVAADVNTNFSAIKTAVDDNDARINTVTASAATNASDVFTNSRSIGLNSSDINANTTNIAGNATNITALQSAKPGYARAVGGTSVFAGIGLTGTGKAVVTLTMNAPASGFAVVTGRMMATIVHTLNTQNTYVLKISAIAGDVADDYDSSFVHVRAKQPTEIYAKMITATAVIPVVAGANIIYLNAASLVGGTSGQINMAKLTAIYVPNAY